MMNISKREAKYAHAALPVPQQLQGHGERDQPLQLTARTHERVCNIIITTDSSSPGISEWIRRRSADTTGNLLAKYLHNLLATQNYIRLL